MWESHSKDLTLHERRLCKKQRQILNDPTHAKRHYFDTRCRRLEDFHSCEQIQPIIKLCPFLVKIIAVFNHVCTCVRMSAEVNFPREGGGCVYLMILFDSYKVLVCQI